METILIGIGYYILCEVVKKINIRFKTKISIRVFLAVVLFIAGGVSYYFNKTNPDVVREVIKFITESFAISQAMFLTIDKILPTDK